MALISKTNITNLATRLSKVRVLLVDDDHEILHLIRGILIKLGFEHIINATDGSEAIQILKNSKSNKGIDLVISDWNMLPVDGLELMRFIRTSPDSPNPFLPIIMLTGRGERADVEKARDAGFSEFLVKPFTAKSLCDRITLCVEQPREFVSSDSYKGPSRRRKEPKLPEGVTENRRKRNAVNTLPGKALKGKIGFDVSMQQIFTPEHVGGAQQYIDSNTDHFKQRALRDIAALMHTYRNACQVTERQKYYNKIKQLAFSIKSHSGTFGYDLGTHVAKSLYITCEKPMKSPEHQLIVVAKHIETLANVFQGDIKGEGGAVGKELMAGLNTLIQKYRG